MHTTTTSPPRLQAPYIGETHFIRPTANRIPYARFPNPVSCRRALAVTNDTGKGRCHRSAAGHRRRHTHPDTEGQPAKLIAAAECYG